MTGTEYVAALAHVLNEHGVVSWEAALEIAPAMLDELAEMGYHLVTPRPLDELAVDGSDEIAHGVRADDADDDDPIDLHWVRFTPKHHLAAIAPQSGVLVLSRPTKPSDDG